MPIDFSTVHNHLEAAVFERVQVRARAYPGLAGRADLLVDVACVALNRLPARYIRHSVDLAFYASENERSQAEKSVSDAVEEAFGYVQARTAMRARG